MPDAYPDNTDRFSGRADAYTKYRPGYSKDVLRFIASELPVKAGDTILDMGSGTGILSNLLLEDLHAPLDISILGLEPNADMRAQQDKDLKPWADKGCFRSVAGTAEATTLPNHSADVAVAAAAFHWFDGPSAHDEVLRVVKPRDGKGVPVALITSAPEEDNDNFGPEFAHAKALRRILHELRDELNFGQAIGNHHAKFNDDALEAFFGGKQRWNSKVFPSIRPMTWDQLHGIVGSYSIAPREGTPEYDMVVRKLQVAFDEHQVDGKIHMLRTNLVVYGYVQ